MTKDLLNCKNYLSKDVFFKYIVSNVKEKASIKEQLVLFIKDKQVNNQLEQIEFSDIHSGNFSYNWNNFVNSYLPNEKNDSNYDGYMSYLGRLMDQVSFDFKLRIKFNDVEFDNKYSFNKDDEKSMSLLYDRFVSFINEGNFSSHICPENYCFNCGSTLKIEFKSWKGTMVEFKEVPKEELSEEDKISKSMFGKYKYYPADNCFKNFLNIKTLKFKTSDVIITDWIKIKEFTDVVEKNGNIYEFDINCAKGRQEAVNHYFEQGFLSINSSRDLRIFNSKEFSDDNGFALGLQKNNEEIDDNGSFMGDVRATTIIEKQKLIEIIDSKINDLDKSKELVSSYLRNNKGSYIIKKMKPGSYDIIFTVKLDRVVSDLLSPINISEKVDPQIIIYPSSLRLTSDNEVSIKKKKI